MGIINTIKGWLNMLTDTKVKNEFNIKPQTSAKMDALVSRCANIYKGVPYWLDDENGVKTVNFAKAVCSETARLTTLAIGIKIEGSARADWLQEQIDKDIYYLLRPWVEYGEAFGTVIAKPNGSGVDLFTPDRFRIVDSDNGNITDIVFEDKAYDATADKWYTRFERHHRTEEGEYEVQNRCYVATSANEQGKPIDIEKTPWSGIMADVALENIEAPLFAVFKTPMANNVDISSPLGLPMFSEAVEELKDLDIAYSRNAAEIFDSDRIVLLDSDRMIDASGKPLTNKNVLARERAVEGMKLPRYVRNVEGNGASDFYQEINPELNTDTRLSGINAYLSQIGYKCGFANGYFVFNEKTGLVTATQVESNDARTIQFIKDNRDRLEMFVDGLIYALDKFADLYDLAPVGEYEVNYDFGDITYNRDEDRARYWSYVVQNRFPFWRFLVKFEGYTEEEAREIEAEMQGGDTLYSEE